MDEDDTLDSPSESEAENPAAPLTDVPAKYKTDETRHLYLRAITADQVPEGAQVFPTTFDQVKHLAEVGRLSTTYNFPSGHEELANAMTDTLGWAVAVNSDGFEFDALTLVVMADGSPGLVTVPTGHGVEPIFDVEREERMLDRYEDGTPK